MSGKVQFDIDHIYYLLNCFSDVNKESDEATSLFSDIVRENKDELASYIYATREVIVKVDDAINNIDSNILILENLIQKYSNEMNNSDKEEIKSYYNNLINQCKEAIYKLESYIEKLRILVSKLNSKKDKINSIIKNNITQLHQINEKNNITMHALDEYNNALIEVQEKARFIDEYKASKIRGYSQIDREFIIKHHGGNTAFSLGGTSNLGNVSSRDDTMNEKLINSLSEEEILIKEKDANMFFNQINGITKIRMPSSSLHRLGGKDFINKMNGLGYSIVTFENESIIDSKGMIHWEKNI